jgi:hypothetical protein
MSNTFIHKTKAKFKNGIIDYSNTDLSFQKQCDRYNYDIAECRIRKNKIKETIIDSLNKIKQ